MCRRIMALTRLRSGQGWVVLFAVAVLSLAGCGSYPGGDAGGSVSSAGCNLTIQEIGAIGDINDIPKECPQLLPDENLLGRMFILGTQEDPQSGVLRIFVIGTDSADNPLQLADFKKAIVSINGNPVDPGLVSVEPVAAGDDVLSLAFNTDYSTSISDAELGTFFTVYSIIMDNLSPPNLPLVTEGMSIIFSSSVVVKQDWTEDPALLKASFQLDAGFPRENTALYDALGFSLLRDPGVDTDGLVERCRPAHMLITFTDGRDTSSFRYTKDTLLPIIDDSKAVLIMLGTLTADKDTLMTLAGDQGAFVYNYSLSNIQDVVEKWAISLRHMVKFTLDPATGFNAGTIRIELGGETVVVERPVDGRCESQ